jgi:aspartyl-tRNA(Asn)/glutamyl-tRNA(Gln) amidotransferase subunit C
LKMAQKGRRTFEAAQGGIERINPAHFFDLAQAKGFWYNQGMLTKEEVIKISKLARIELTDAEVEKFQKELSTVLDYVEELKRTQFAVAGDLDPTHEVTGLVNVQREDKVAVSENHDAILSQAPAIKDGFYKVKAIL